MASLPAAPPASRRWPGLGLVVLLCLSLGKRERPEGERGAGGAVLGPNGRCPPGGLGGLAARRALVPASSARAEAGYGARGRLAR